MEPPPPDFKPWGKKKEGGVRKTAVPGDVRLEVWSDGLITEKERELFSKIDSEKKPPAPEAMIFVENEAWTSHKIYLERVAGDEGDSGWFPARAHSAAPGARLLSL